MSQLPGLVIGIVDDLNDPEKLDRIRVTFPWMADGVKSYWARPARLMAGGDRGTFFMPEKGDEALVAFEHGDVRFPYIVGFLWNGVDKPPNADIDNNVRRIRTTSGHQMDFDDRPGQEKIHLKSSKNHEVLVDDTPGQAKIRLKTAGNQSVEITDVPPSITIQLAPTAGIVRIEETSKGIEVNVPLGLVNVTCMSATVTAPGGVTVTAPVATFAGVINASMVQAPLIQAGAVVSGAVVGAAYTPAPGNTFGL